MTAATPDQETTVTRLRFVILRHEVGAGMSRTDKDHFDWMFESGPSLTTFATEPLASFHRRAECEARALANHRLHYLDYEGEISGNRGRVQRVLRGSYGRLATEDRDTFAAELEWRSSGITVHRARVDFYLKLPVETGLADNFGEWRCRFSPRKETNLCTGP